MVAYLLQLGQRRQHHALALDALRLGDRLLGIAQHGLVERGLLARQRAEDLHLHLLGQVGDDGAIGLEPAQDEGAGEPAQPRHGRRVAAGVDRHEEGPFELRLRAEEPGVQELHDRPQVADVVLDRRAGERDAVGGGERAGGARLLGLGVLDVLGLVEHDRGPADGPEVLEVTQQQRVARDDDGMLARRLQERLSPAAAHAVVDERLQGRREALRLALPVADDRSRTHDERGPLVARASLGEQQAEGLDGLAETHVVGQARAEAPGPEERQPRVAALLVRPQGRLQAGRRRQVSKAPVALEPLENLPDPARGFDALDGQRTPRGRRAEGDAEDVAHRCRRRLRSPQLQGGVDLLGRHVDPLPAQANERLLHLRERLQLGRRQRIVAERDLPIDVDQLLEPDSRAALLHLRAAHLGPHPEPQARALPGPPRRKEHAEARLLEGGRRLRQEGVRPVRVGRVAGGRGAVKALLDGWAQAGGLAERGEQMLAHPRRAEESFGRVALPGLGGRNEEARVAPGLQQVAHRPRPTAVALGLVGGLLEPEAEAERRVAGHGHRPAPLAHRGREPGQVCRCSIDDALPECERAQPGLVPALGLQRGHGARGRTHELVHEHRQDVVDGFDGRASWRCGRGARERPASAGHRGRELQPALGIRAVENRRPSGAPAVFGLDDPGKEALPRDDRAREAEHERPEGEVLRDDEPGSERVPADGGTQDDHRLGRRQRNRGQDPRHEARGGGAIGGRARARRQERARGQRSTRDRGQPGHPPLRVPARDREAGHRVHERRGKPRRVGVVGRSLRLDPPGGPRGRVPAWRRGRCALAPDAQPLLRQRGMEQDH